MASCDLTNKIVANAATNPKTFKIIANNVNFIEDMEKQIVNATDKNVKAMLEQNKLWAEANIYYIWISSYLWDVLRKWELMPNWNSVRDDFIDVIKDTLKSIMPDNAENIDNLYKLWALSEDTYKSFKPEEIANIVAFNASIYHKFNNFKEINDVVTSSEYLARQWAHWTTPIEYSIYRELMHDCVSWEVSKSKFLKKIKDVKPKNIDDLIIKSESEALDRINSAVNPKELEEAFLLSANFWNWATLDAFVNKFATLRSSPTSEVVWNSLWVSQVNPWKIIEQKSFKQMERWIIANNLFWEKWIPETPDYYELIKWTVDLFDGKKEVTIWWKKFTQADKTKLYNIVWEWNIENELIKKWYRSYQYQDLRNMAEASSEITIKPDNEIDELFSSKSWNPQTYNWTLLKIINSNDKTASVWEHIFFWSSVFNANINDVDPLWQSYQHIEIWTPMSRIESSKELVDKINTSINNWEKINIIFPDERAFNDFRFQDDVYATIKSDKKWLLSFTYPRDWSSSFYMENGKVNFKVINNETAVELTNLMKPYTDLLFTSNPYIPKYGQSISDDIVKIWYWDERTVERLQALYWFQDNIVWDPTRLINQLNTLQRISWKYIPGTVDLKVAWSEMSDDIDFYIEEAKNLSDGVILKDNVSLADAKNAYFNRKYAKSLENKEYALYIFLSQFKASAWDIAENSFKQSKLFTDLWKLWLKTDFTWRWNFVKLLSDPNTTEEIISNDVFLTKTIAKSNLAWNEMFIKNIDLYNYCVWNVNMLDKQIAWKVLEPASDIQKQINVPREWMRDTFIENDVTLAPIHTSTFESAWYKMSWELESAISDINSTKVAWDSWALWESSSLISISNKFDSDIDRLFDEYTKYMDYILSRKWEEWFNVNQSLRKLHNSFLYEVIKLENWMQTTLWMAYEWSLWWFYHSIPARTQSYNVDDYMLTLNKQRDAMKSRLNVIRNNLNEASSNWWVIYNWNVVQWNIIQDWASYLYYLSKQNWEDIWFENIKMLDGKTIRKRINDVKKDLNNKIQSNWIMYTIYNAISDKIRNTDFLDDYKLIDDWELQIPKIITEINPSWYTKWKIIDPENNKILMVSIFDSISKMYSDWWYILSWEPLVMWWNIQKNSENINKIVNEKIDLFIDWLWTEFRWYDWKGIRDVYNTVFQPYSEFIPMPQKVVSEITNKKWLWDVDVGLYMDKYIWIKQVEINTSEVRYRWDYVDKVDNIIWDLEELAMDSYQKAYSDIIWWWLTQFLFNTSRSILIQDSVWGRKLAQLYGNTAEKGKLFANVLSDVIATTKTVRFNPSKLLDKWTTASKLKWFVYNFDKELFHKAQDSFTEIYWKSDTQIAERAKTHSERADIIARRAAEYFNTYKTVLKWTLDEWILDWLKDVFYKIWRNQKWEIDDTLKNADVRNEVSHLMTVLEMNAYLWIFNMKNAPETPLKKISFKQYGDGKLILWKEKNLDFTEKTQTEAFNKMFWTNLTEKQYIQNFESMFWWEIAQRKEWVEKILWAWRRTKSVVFNKLTKMPLTVWLNIFSAFATWFLPWIARWRKLVEWISYLEQKAIWRIITKYNLLPEYAELTKEWFNWLVEEAIQLWWWSMWLWFARSLNSGKIANNLELMTMNTNNVLDLALMWNYKIYSVYNAMRWLSWRKFASAIELEKYLDNIDDTTRANVLSEITAQANRWFNSISAASIWKFDKRVIPKLMTEIKRWSDIRRMWKIVWWWISMLNSRWDWIIWGTVKMISQSVDIAKYLAFNKFSPEAFEKVNTFIKWTPEFTQMVATIFSDINILARAIRISAWDDNIEWDADWVDYIKYLVEAITMLEWMTTIWQWYWASRFWQTVWAWIEIAWLAKNKNEEMQWENEEKYNVGKVLFSAIWYKFLTKLFAELRYLKPYDYMFRDIKNWISWEEALKWLIFQSAWWAMKYTLEDSFNPNSLAITFQDKWEVSPLFGWEQTEDTRQAYASSIIDASSFNFWRSAFKGSLPMTRLITPVAKLFNKWRLTQDEVEELTIGSATLWAVYKWEPIKVSENDANSIKKYFFTTDLVTPSYIDDYLDKTKKKWWNTYVDGQIAVLFQAIWPEATHDYYKLLNDSESDEDYKRQWIALDYLQDYVNTHDFWEMQSQVESIILQTRLWLVIKEWEPSWKWKTNQDKQEYYMKKFTENEDIVKKNNYDIYLSFAMNKHSRDNNDRSLDIYDNDWNLLETYMPVIKEIAITSEAIRNWDVEYLAALANPLSNATRFTMWKILKDDWTIDQVALDLVWKASNYIQATSQTRPEWVTAEMLANVAKTNIEWLQEAYLQWIKLSWWLSQWWKNLVDSLYNTESSLAQYISNLENWLDAAKWWWGSYKLKQAQVDFASISEALDKIRWDFESRVSLPVFELKTYQPASWDRSIFSARPTGNYSMPSVWKPFGNDIIETPSDIKRTYKKQWSFKFREV